MKSIKSLLVIEVLVLLLMFILVIVLLSSVSLPLILSFAFAYLVPRFIYSSSRIYCTAGHFALLTIAAIMALGITINIWQFTVELGGTIENPILINSDSNKYYRAAIAMYYGNDFNRIIPYSGYPRLISTIWHITGINVIVPLIINMLFALMSVVLSAFISIRLIDRKELNRFVGAVAILFTGGCCYYIGCGMVILKDPSIYLGVTLCAYSLVSFYKKSLSKFDYLIFLIGIVILAFNRVGVCYMIAIGVLLLSMRSPRSLLLKSSLLFIIIMLGCFIGNYVASYGIDYQYEIIEGSRISVEYITTPQQKPLTHIIGDYFSYPIWIRAILLPITSVIQYLIPFPWNFMRDTPFGYSQIYSHIAYGWYFVGGITLYYYIMLLIGRKCELTLWALWAIICYLVPAYLFAGSVSRYFLPFIPLFVPLAITIIIRLKEGFDRKQFKLFAIFYFVMLALTLMVCYYLQSSLVQ